MNDFIEELAWGFAGGVVADIIGTVVLLVVGIILMIICKGSNGETNRVHNRTDSSDAGDDQSDTLRVSPRTRGGGRDPPDDDEYHQAC